MNLAPPSSQRAGDRPISFLLDDGSSGPAAPFIDLLIRPQDLTRPDPSRLNVQQTLGGAWADDFGAGIANISISGHTGWRRTESSSDDGLERFQKLKTTVFDRWHESRERATRAGRDPNTVKLIFSDALDNFSEVVAPVNFTLRRSKDRPLLAQYQINMMVLGPGTFPVRNQAAVGTLGGIFGGGGTSLLQSLGLESFTRSLSQIADYLNTARRYVDRNLLGPVRGFMLQTARLYREVRNAVGGVTSAMAGLSGSLVAVAQDITHAALNIFRSFAAVASLPAQARAFFQNVAGAYANIFCVLRNALRNPLVYSDYSDLYGASNCSSTSGGRPLSSMYGQNPFYAVSPTRSPLPVAIDANGAAAIAWGANIDPVLSPPTVDRLAQGATAMTQGIAVTVTPVPSSSVDAVDLDLAERIR